MTALLAIGVIAIGQSAQSQDGTQGQTAAQIISKMLAHYNSASTIKGSIVLTQSALNSSGQMKTELQIEQPAKFYLRQDKSAGKGRTWIVTSDGKHFSYDAPARGLDDQSVGRLVEAIKIGEKSLTFRDVYAASVSSIGDRSPVLDIVISRKEDLEYLRNKWTTIRLDGTIQLGEEEVYQITGTTREKGVNQDTARFQMLITKEGDLRKYTVAELVNLENLGSKQVTSEWSVDIKVNGPVDQNLFKVILK